MSAQFPFFSRPQQVAFSGHLNNYVVSESLTNARPLSVEVNNSIVKFRFRRLKKSRTLHFVRERSRLNTSSAGMAFTLPDL